MCQVLHIPSHSDEPAIGDPDGLGEQGHPVRVGGAIHDRYEQVRSDLEREDLDRERPAGSRTFLFERGRAKTARAWCIIGLAIGERQCGGRGWQERVSARSAISGEAGPEPLTLVCFQVVDLARRVDLRWRAVNEFFDEHSSKQGEGTLDKKK